MLLRMYVVNVPWLKVVKFRGTWKLTPDFMGLAAVVTEGGSTGVGDIHRSHSFIR